MLKIFVQGESFKICFEQVNGENKSFHQRMLNQLNNHTIHTMPHTIHKNKLKMANTSVCKT